jgi:hypothetical protein
MRGVVAILGACALVLALAAAPAFGHSERTSYFPNFNTETNKFDPPVEVGPPGKPPAYRNRGTALVVCKGDSGRRIQALPRRTRRERAVRRRNLTLLRHCRFRHIQAAVTAARNNTRILLLPGVYREEPSLAVPDEDPKCKDMKQPTSDGHHVPTYEYQYNCPNAQNLVAIHGDGPDADRKCDRKCNIQISGTSRPQDVYIDVARQKEHGIRADRADGVYLSNFTIELANFNNIYVLETNGFHFNKIVSGHALNYDFLTFTSDNGLYENLEAYGGGDSGIYPGSGPEGNCKRYGIEIRNVNSHHNNIGWSGTAGNGVYTHDSRFRDNAAGITTDSFASDHPGMPQDCSKWERNQVYSNNLDLYGPERDEYCQKPARERDPRKTCPTFQVPVGTGMLIAGGNRNIVRDNQFWDNWRHGVRILWVPTNLRGEDPSGQSQNNQANQFDTSNGNRVESNKMGVRPDGTRDPNGLDVYWDEEGQGNCWGGNTGAGGAAIRSDPGMLPACPQGSSFSTGNPLKQAPAVPCTQWDPHENTDPPGCDWFNRPPEPK